MPMRKSRLAAFGKWRRNRLAACLGGVLALLVGAGVITAAPAMAITHTNTTLKHVCENIGTDDNGTSAIVCTDLIQQAYYGSAGFIGYDVLVHTEALCQNSANTVVQCANITVDNEPAGALYGAGSVWSQACGHSNGNCPAGRYFVPGYTLAGSPQSCIGEVWAVTLSPGTSIELPKSGYKIVLPADFGTPHATVGSC
jgi:hypothetical protein